MTAPNRKRWNQHERTFLIKNHSTKSESEIAEHLQRSKTSVKQQINQMGLTPYISSELQRLENKAVDMIKRGSEFWEVQEATGLTKTRVKILMDLAYYERYGWRNAIPDVPIGYYYEFESDIKNALDPKYDYASLSPDEKGIYDSLEESPDLGGIKNNQIRLFFRKHS